MPVDAIGYCQLLAIGFSAWDLGKEGGKGILVEEELG